MKKVNIIRCFLHIFLQTAYLCLPFSYTLVLLTVQHIINNNIIWDTCLHIFIDVVDHSEGERRKKES